MDKQGNGNGTGQHSPKAAECAVTSAHDTLVKTTGTPRYRTREAALLTAATARLPATSRPGRVSGGDDGPGGLPLHC